MKCVRAASPRSSSWSRVWKPSNGLVCRNRSLEMGSEALPGIYKVLAYEDKGRGRDM